MMLSIKQKLSDARALQAGEVSEVVAILASAIYRHTGLLVTGSDDDSITVDVPDENCTMSFTVKVIAMQNTFDACLKKVEEEQHED